MKNYLLIISILIFQDFYVSAQTFTTVSTFAGTTTAGLVNGPVTSARFNFNYGVCSDSAGNIYVADLSNHCIRKISGGIVTTVAGNGTAGDVDAQGSAARFYSPSGVYFKNGYLYICDNANNKIKRMDMAFNVVTIAGSGTPGFANGPSSSARFYEPKSIVVDNANNVFVADYENHCIRKIANGVVTTVAGVGGSPGDVLGSATTARFNRPRDLCVDAAGNLYVADLVNDKIKLISPTGNVTLVAGSGATSSVDGTGAGASFSIPVGIDWGTSGDLFVLDAGTGKIRRLTTTGIVTTIAGAGSAGYVNGPVATARFGSLPQDICIDPAGNLYVGDRTNNVVRVLTNTATLNANSSVTNISCFGGNNGTATVTPSGGTAPYTFVWSPSGGTNASAINLSMGTYTCLITDAIGATSQQTVTITQPSQLTASISSIPVSCSNQGSGTAFPSGGTGPYTYSWSSGGTAATENNLTTGTYSCTVTDANGCSITQTVTITQFTSLSASIVASSIFCYGGIASATVAVSGGNPGYTYSWSPSGGTAQTATGLSAGNYTCTITDASGCVNQQTISISQPTLLATSSVSNNLVCFGNQNGSAFVATTGGTPSYAYSWSPSGGTGSTANGLSAGSYTVTVTDANSCISTSIATVTSPPQLVAVVSQPTLDCFGDCNGIAIVNTSGGTGSYTYNWNPTGCVVPTCENLCAGSYSVTVTDSSGCSATSSFTITQPPQLSVLTSHTNENLWIGNNGTATATVSGGTPGYTYLWMPGNQTTSTATGLSAGNYTCTITDANGCTSIVTVTINITEDVGIAAQEHPDFSLILFPNPANDFLQIAVASEKTGAVTIEIYNMIGEKVDVVNLGNASSVNYSYSTIALANGIYFVQVSSGSAIAKKKFTVLH